MKENIHIIEYTSRAFKNRQDAGKQIGEVLGDIVLNDPLILGIPRGGVVIADAAAQVLKADVDIVLSTKLGAPGNPELAIGSLSENGKVFLDPGYTQADKGNEYFKREKKAKLEKIETRRKNFRKIRPKADMSGRDLVVVDDGLATGSTMLAALWGAGQEKPARLLAAVPVGSEDALKRISHAADEIYCLRLPVSFMAVSQFYESFSQTTDEEAANILKNYS